MHFYSSDRSGAESYAIGFHIDTERQGVGKLHQSHLPLSFKDLIISPASAVNPIPSHSIQGRA